MRLSHLRIQNFRSCREVSLDISSMHALVGGNNAGKSTVLHALDFFFNPSSKNIKEESFWNKDISLEIRVEGHFTDLTQEETAALGSCLRMDGTFLMARTARFGIKGDAANDAGDDDSDKISIGQQYNKEIPALQWLCDSSISTANITAWWADKKSLVIGEHDFAALLGSTKPSVSHWKEKSAEFAAAHADDIPMDRSWIDNPKGYANVLKKNLPFFILVPAVRDVADESKGTKSSPFGKLLYAILNAVTDEKKAEIEGMLKDVASHMNRTGGEHRVPLIAETESQLNNLLGDFFKGCDLEIEFSTPSLELLLSSPKLYVDDGFRNAIENKGHGLQRAVIFSILRRYAEHMSQSEQESRRKLFLAVEEPELYMHPQAQRTIRKVFRRIANSGDQLIYTTHSSLLVDVNFFDEIVRMESRTVSIDGANVKISTSYQLPMCKMLADIEVRHPQLKGTITTDSLREHYSHAYNPRRSEGFFASKVILVEGATEEYSLPIYADALPDCNFDEHGISVVECGGKGTMDRLYRIFNELHIPCFLLFDFDDGNSDSKIINSSKELLRLAGMSPDVPDGPLVSNNLACFPKNWEADLAVEIPSLAELTQAARKELGLGSDSGKPLVARYVARKLSEQDVPQIPPTIKKIIESAMNVEWSASCLNQKEEPAPLQHVE